jgi:poly-gamma-glutamate synthesis protein (capsule biosynthesis protein)
MKDISVVAAGDSLITMKQSVHSEPAFLEMVRRIRDADAAFTNLEMLLHDYESDVYPAATPGGIYVRADPAMIGELKWMGFNLISTANNHSLDYMHGGLFRTIRHLRTAQVTFAGTGPDLASARRPGYLETSKGRVALLAASSDFPPFARAGSARRDMHGRPGLNPLGFDSLYIVDDQTLTELQRLEQRIGLPRRVQTEGIHYCLGGKFVVGEELGERTVPDAADMQGNLEAVHEAARQADWVIFSIHAHKGVVNDEERPPEFLEIFARACIDQGAHAVIGHGYHGTRAIEIRNGRPIFYGLGNFIFQNETVIKMPADFYAQVGINPYEGTPADAFDARPNHWPRPGYPFSKWFLDDEINWTSVLAHMVFNGDRLTELELFPIDLGQDRPRSQRGRPCLASAETAERILQRLQRLSQRYGTRITIKDGVGIVHL